MDEVKHLMLLTYLHETQQVKLQPDEGEAVLKITESFLQRIHGLAGTLPFDCEPAAYVRALSELKEDA